MTYFGTNGVRGRFDELTPDLALKLSQAIGIYFKSGTVIVARDCRITGEILQNSVIAGLASVGCKVIDIGVSSSPTAEFMIEKMKADGCIIVSASHNPPEWNALKVVDGSGVSVSRERGMEIEALLGKIKLAAWNKVGKIIKYDMATADHIEAIKNKLKKEIIAKKKPKIIIDCGNGTASIIAPKLFKDLGCEIISLNSHPDGNFPGRPSEPTEANVKELLAAVKSNKAHGGVAWDGDGDRVIFVDEKGNYVIGDKVCALSIIWKSEGKKIKDDVITTVATSKAVEDVAAKHGAKVRYTAIGAPYLCEEMKKNPGFMAGEEVGGVIWPEISMAKDGFFTAAKMAEAVCEKPLSKWLEEVPEYHNVKMKIEADQSKKEKIVKNVLEYAKKNGLNYLTVDGVRINFSDSWVIVRASGTENYVRIFAEAKTKEQAQKIADGYLKIASS